MPTVELVATIRSAPETVSAADANATRSCEQTESPAHVMPSGRVWPALQSSTHSSAASAFASRHATGASPVAGAVGQSASVVQPGRAHTPNAGATSSSRMHTSPIAHVSGGRFTQSPNGSITAPPDSDSEPELSLPPVELLDSLVLGSPVEDDDVDASGSPVLVLPPVLSVAGTPSSEVLPGSPVELVESAGIVGSLIVLGGGIVELDVSPLLEPVVPASPDPESPHASGMIVSQRASREGSSRSEGSMAI